MKPCSSCIQEAITRPGPSIAVAILLAGGLMAQTQSTAVLTPVQEKQNGRPAETSAAAPSPAAKSESSTSVLLLPGCDASRTSNDASKRDYSTPASRLVGRWASTATETAGIACHYFGPVDGGTATGKYITYELEAVDAKTDARSPIRPGSGKPPRKASWNRREQMYRVVKEDQRGDWVTVETFSPDRNGSPIVVETHNISCNGMTDSRKGFESARYVDDREAACSDGDPRWKDDFSRLLQPRPPSPTEIIVAAGMHEIQYKVSGPYKASLTYRNAMGGTDQMTVSLPWTFTFAGKPGQFAYLSAQNTEDWGTIECTIYLDGAPARRAISNSPYGIASVSGTVPAAHSK